MVGGTIYIRWSSEAQTGRDSLRRQLEAARRYATDHQIDVRETIIDEATSAFSGSHLTRGRLGDFLKRVEAGEVSTPHQVLVESFDRLNRQTPLDALVPFTAMMNAGLTVITLIDGQVFTKESLSADGGIRLLMSLLVMVRAHEESATKSKRVGAAWERKRRTAASIKLTKTCPGWLRLKPDRSAFEEIEDRVGVVRRIFKETSEGIGKATLATRLNAAAVPTFRGRNGWHPSYIQKVIASDAVLGIFQPHAIIQGKRRPVGDPVPRYFPVIVDAALVGKARAAVIGRRAGASGRKGPRFANLFAGVAYCGACRSKMGFVAKAVEETYLGCSGARRGRGCVSRALFNYQTIEDWVLDTLEGPCLKGHPEALEGSDQERRNSLASSVQELTGRLVRLLDQFSEEGSPEVADAAKAIRRERDLLQVELRSLDERIAVTSHAPTPEIAGQILRSLRLRFRDSDEAVRYAVRAEASEIVRGLGAQITLSSQSRTMALRLGAGPEVSSICAPARTVPVRDSASGRFTGTRRIAPGSSV
jgi:DNA invertase Pin-like site-specific DNA recombinase